MNTPYSHKYEIADYVSSMIIGEPEFKDGSVIPDMIRESQTFRIPDLKSLPTVKDYISFYEFMKSPYKHYMIEMQHKGNWFVISVNDYRDLDDLKKQLSDLTGENNDKSKESCIACMLLYKKDTWNIWGDLIIEMDETGYEVTTKLKNLDDEISDRYAWTVFEFMVAVNTPNIIQKEVKPPKLINENRKKEKKVITRRL